MPNPIGKGIFKFNPNPDSYGSQLELNYFLCFFVMHLSSSDIVKLTMAPTVAKIIVFTTSSDKILGTILKNVPPAVPTKVGLLCTCIFFSC